MDDRNNNDYERGGRSSGRRSSNFRGRRPRSFYSDKIGDVVDYKDTDLLKLFITERGKIRPRRQTGISASEQRKIATAVKRARHMALLPFVDDSTEE